jgi:hypothetical protein
MKTRTFAFVLALAALDAPDLLAQTAADDCLPACRSGFVCVRGQCVSACNPPCPAGQQCVNAECVYAAQSAPPPAMSPPPAGPPAAAPAPAPYGGAPPAAPVGAPPAAPVAPTQPYTAAPTPVQTQPAPDQVSSAPTAPGVRTHDGFYLRMGIGVGGGSYAGTLKSSDQLFDGAGVDGKGFTIPVELSVGWTVAPGLVIGPGIFGASMPSPRDRAKNYGATVEADAGSVVFSSLGPFADYYFDPRQGLHVQGGIAYAVAVAGKSTDSSAAYKIPSSDYSGSGWSAMLGFGWETWVGDQWSIGVLGRLQYGHVSLDASEGHDSVSMAFLLPTVLATFTYH